MQILEIPQDVLDIMRECCWENDGKYCEFDISLSITKDGDIQVKDGIGLWGGDMYAEDMQPTTAWETIRKWWEDEADNIKAQQAKKSIESQIAELQKDLVNLESTAKKKKWFW